MDRSEIYGLLTARGMKFEVTEHKAVYNMQDLDSVELPYPERDAKNLFVRDDKKRNYYLITVKGDRTVDLKEFRTRYGLRPLSFASSDDLMRYLGLSPGSVSPFGLLNDTEHKVRLFIDSYFIGGIIGMHPNDNTATVWVMTEDLIDLLKGHGTDIAIADLTSSSDRSCRRS